MPSISPRIGLACVIATRGSSPSRRGGGPHRDDLRTLEAARHPPPEAAGGRARGGTDRVEAARDAVVLFDGSSLDAWRSLCGGPAKWKVKDGYIETAPGAGPIETKGKFGDIQLHVEWAAPNPPLGKGQDRGNSGIFLMGRFEIQVLDSYKADTYADGQAGAIYGQYPPLFNARRPRQWQLTISPSAAPGTTAPASSWERSG